MDRSYDDRDRYGRESADRMSHGRARYDQHDEERWRDRESDRYLRDSQWRHEGRAEYGGAYDRRNTGAPSLHGRYQYGPEEDPHQWDERWRDERGEYSRVGGPERQGPYRSPNREEEYGMFREGNYAGYDTWHGHNYFQDHNDAPAMGSADRFSWIREPDRRDQEWDRPYRDRFDADRDFREVRFRTERPDENERRRDGARRHEDHENREREDRFRNDRGDGSRDRSGTWRQFESWTHPEDSYRRSEGLGYNRSDDYGDRFWSGR